jgi:antitoxin MazE
MLVSIVPIGNSKGIRIPKNIINEINLEDKAELEVHNNEIIIRPIVKKSRQGWEESFSKMHQAALDEQLVPDLLDDESFEWEW